MLRFGKKTCSFCRALVSTKARGALQPPEGLRLQSCYEGWARGESGDAGATTTSRCHVQEGHMGPVWKTLTIVGGLWGLIGTTNIFAGCTMEDLAYSAFLLMFNIVVFVVPGGVIAGLGPVLRNGRRRKRAEPRRRRAMRRATRWEETRDATTWR
jgi:hypothetical protein